MQKSRGIRAWGRASTASRLLECQTEIQERWKRKVARISSPSQEVGRAILTKDIPLLLRGMISAVRSEKPTLIESKIRQILQNPRPGRINLKTILKEYTYLRESVFESYEQHFGPLPSKERDIILHFFHLEVIETVENLSRYESLVRDNFVTMLSHDLRNPLTSAKLQNQLLQKHAKTLEQCRLFSFRIARAISRIDELIKSLVEGTKIQAGEMIPLRIIECDISQLIRDIIEELSLVHGYRFKLNIPDRLVGFWSADEIRRAVENLAENAVRYGAPGRPIRVAIKNQENWIELSVHNYGDPINSEEKERLLQPFKPSLVTPESGPQSLGLEVVLIRGVAESHGGKLEIESNEEDGTTFSLILPRDCRFKNEPALAQSA